MECSKEDCILERHMSCGVPMLYCKDHWKQMTMSTLAQARADIAKQVTQPRARYASNIVTLSLQKVAREFGYARANTLIDEYELTKIFEIKKVLKKGKRK